MRDGTRRTRRQLGTNPRALGTNPRARGTSPRWQTAAGRAYILACSQRRIGLGVATIRQERALSASLRADALSYRREVGQVCSACEGSGWRPLSEDGPVIRCDHAAPLLCELDEAPTDEPP